MVQAQSLDRLLTLHLQTVIVLPQLHRTRNILKKALALHRKILTYMGKINFH